MFRRNLSDEELRLSLIRELIEELDSLYDEETYDPDENEMECISKKIALRNNVLNSLLNSNTFK